MMRQLSWLRYFILVMLVFTMGLLGGSAPRTRAASGAQVVSLGGVDIRDSSAAVADFDGDGDKEIVIGGTNGTLYVLVLTGSTWSIGWQVQTADTLRANGSPTGSPCVYTVSDIRSAPAVGDLDDDGDLEIVVSTGGDTGNHRNGGVLVYTYNESSSWGSANRFVPVSGWPQPKLDKVGGGAGSSNPDGCWDGIWGSPAVGDLDGDGDLEVIVEGFDRHIHAWHHNGTAVTGWPIYRYTDETDTVEGTDCLLRGGWSSPALGDIDDDGLPEVVVGTDSPPWACPGNWSGINYQYGTVWAINGDSTNVPGWPVTTKNNIKSAPALGDIDGDGDLEVVVSSADSQESGDGSWVYAWDGDGDPLDNWPIQTGGDIQAPPALGDIDDDGQPEVVVGCGVPGGSCTGLYAWNGNGSQVFSPKDMGVAMIYSPILADYDGDDDVDILIAGLTSSHIAVVEHDGVGVPDTTTLSDPSLGPLFSSPLVDDVDGDGNLEVVIGQGGFVYIWDVSGSITDDRPWPMFHRNVQRTGTYAPPKLGFVDEITLFHQVGSGSTESKALKIKNLGDDEFDWAVTHADPTHLAVTPSTGVVSGTVELQLVVTTTGLASDTWHTWTITATGTSGGVDVLDSPQNATLRVYVGDIGRAYMPIVLRDYSP